MIRLFEIENDVVKATEHCYTIPWLKAIMDKFPKEHINIFAYVFYMTCPNEENPYFNVIEEIKEDTIEKAIHIDFDTEDELVVTALQEAEKLYETTTVRAYKAIKIMLDNLGKYMETAKITHGRDGNINSLLRAAKDFNDIRQSYKGVMKDLEAEQQSQVRGGQQLSYDQ